MGKGNNTGAIETYRMYVGGKWCESASGQWFESFNPYTGKVWARIPRGTAADVDHAVTTAAAAFKHGAWPRLHASQRGALLRRLGDLVAERAQELAEIEVRDNGKLIAEMSAQLRYIPQWYYYFGGLADKVADAKSALLLVSRESGTIFVLVKK